MRERKDNQDLVRERVRKLHAEGLPANIIGVKLGKTTDAILHIIKRMERKGKGRNG